MYYKTYCNCIVGFLKAKFVNNNWASGTQKIRYILDIKKSGRVHGTTKGVPCDFVGIDHIIAESTLLAYLECKC